MRANKWSKESDYIVNLTRQLVCKESLISIANSAVGRDGDYDPVIVHSHVIAVVMNDLKKMTDATLGRICAYATAKGAHHGQHLQGTARPKFINRTGLAGVFRSFEKNVITVQVAIGEFLEQMAGAVITCVVVDLIQQEKWQAEWESFETMEA